MSWHDYIRAERSSPQNGKPRALLFEPTAAVLAALAGRGAAAHAGAQACRLLRALLRRLAAQTSIARAAKSATPPVSTGHLAGTTDKCDLLSNGARAIAFSGAVALDGAPFGLSDAKGWSMVLVAPFPCEANA